MRPVEQGSVVTGYGRTWAFTWRAWLWAEQGLRDSVLCSQPPLVAAGGQTMEAGVELEEGTYLEVIVEPRLFPGASG